MTSGERVSQLTSEANRSTDSVGEILRTNGRTHEDISYPPFKSESSVPHARVLPDSSATGDAAGSAAARERYEVVRRGEREPLCWHVRALVKRRDNYRCRRCCSQSELEVDHILPYSAGGTHDTRNLQALCAPCNDRKSNFKDEWAPAKRHAIVLTCLRCRENGASTEGGAERVWCLKCKSDSYETPLRIGAIQSFLAEHCDQIERPALDNREAWGLIDYLLPTDLDKWRTERRKAREALPPRDDEPEVPHPLCDRLAPGTLGGRSEDVEAQNRAAAEHRARVAAAHAELHPEGRVVTPGNAEYFRAKGLVK